jgi:transposase
VSIAELCRREGIASSMYYGWSKEFLEVGKKRLARDTARAATSDEVKDLRREAQALKEVVADLTLENRLLKKSMIGDGGRRRELLRSASTGDVDEGDLLVARSVEAHNRFRRRLQDHATTLLVKIRARFRR